MAVVPRSCLVAVVIAPIGCWDWDPPPPPLPPLPDLAFSCDGRRIDTTAVSPQGVYAGHEPESVVCTVRQEGLEPGAAVTLTVETLPMMWESTGEQVQATAGISGPRPCAPPASATLAPITPERLGLLVDDLERCVTCAPGSRGQVGLRVDVVEAKELRPHPDQVVDFAALSRDVSLRCFTRDPTRFWLSIEAGAPAPVGQLVTLEVEAGDDEGAALVDELGIYVFPPLVLPPPHGLRGGDEDGVISVVLERDEVDGVARPSDELGFRCPDQPGRYPVTVRFHRPEVDGPAEDSAIVVCTAS